MSVHDLFSIACVSDGGTSWRNEPRNRKQEPQLGEPELMLTRKQSELLRFIHERLKEAGVPPYVIFHDATLRAIARANPTTLAALSTVSGIGSRKIERYGATLLELLHPPPTAQ